MDLSNKQINKNVSPARLCARQASTDDYAWIMTIVMKQGSHQIMSAASQHMGRGKHQAL